MQIQSIKYPKINNRYQTTNTKNNKQLNQTNQTYSQEYNKNIQYAPITFSGIHNIKPKKLNIETEKNKLLKQITDMLNLENISCDAEDFLMNSLMTALNAFRAALKKQQIIYEELEALSVAKNMNIQQKINKLNQLKKELNIVNKLK